MRNKLLTICIVFFVIGCAVTHKAIKNSGQLDGSWVPVMQEIGGTVLPKQVYEKQILTISDSTYTLVAESTDKGVLKYAEGKMDIYGKDGVNTGKHFTAIYKLEKNQLSICYNLNGLTYPENFSTKGKPMHFVSVFLKKE